MKTIFKAYKSFWVKAFDFQGITNRKEYGLILISNIFFTLIFIVLMIFFLYYSEFPGSGMYYQSTDIEYRHLYKFTLGIFYFYNYALVIPNLSLNIRRIRDTGKEWYWIFVNLIPIFGNIYYLVNLLKPSIKIKKIDKNQKINLMNTKNNSKKLKVTNLNDELQKIISLKEKGFLTNEEFKLAKAKILD